MQVYKLQDEWIKNLCLSVYHLKRVGKQNFIKYIILIPSEYEFNKKNSNMCASLLPQR